jgi:hypothetical protein
MAESNVQACWETCRTVFGRWGFWTGLNGPDPTDDAAPVEQAASDSDKGYVMKRNDEAVTARPLLSRGANGKPTPKHSAEDDAIVKAHQELMTHGERIFCLRDVHRYWSTPRISPREVEELERENLIERSPNPICSIRLTAQGVLMKNSKPLKVS